MESGAGAGCDIQDFQIDCTLENSMSLDIPYTSRAKRIVVVGSININVTLNVDELPQPGRTVSTGRYSVSPGGKGANQSISVARLGNEVSLIGKVGSNGSAGSFVSLQGGGRKRSWFLC